MTPAPRPVVGIVGVGTIAAAMVEAISASSPGTRFVLSPRSARTAARLAATVPDVVVARDNQEVLDASDLVMLSMLPSQVEGVCAELRFSDRHIVIGLAGGWPPARLAPLVEPASLVCQLVPLPMIAMHTGPVVLFPEVPEVRALLEGCGDLVVPEDESQLMALACASATMSTFFALQSSAAEWLAGQGIPRESATRYIRSLFLGLATEAAGTQDLGPLVKAHETPGGLNEQVRSALQRLGTFDMLADELSDLRTTRFA